MMAQWAEASAEFVIRQREITRQLVSRLFTAVALACLHSSTRQFSKRRAALRVRSRIRSVWR